MAEGFLRAWAGDRFEVASAGTEATRVHALAIEVMDEAGIDLRSHTPKTLDAFLAEPRDYVITVCDSANERCPLFPGGTTRVHWSFDDPSAAAGSEAERLATFRRVRDAIAARIRVLLAQQDAHSRVPPRPPGGGSPARPTGGAAPSGASAPNRREP
jgi:arsenate reductase